MKRKRKHTSYHWKHVHHRDRPIRWLPVDSRMITPIFRFGQVRGVARLFLELEITLALLIVAGTFLWAGLRLLLMIVK